MSSCCFPQAFATAALRLGNSASIIAGVGAMASVCHFTVAGAVCQAVFPVSVIAVLGSRTVLKFAPARFSRSALETSQGGG